MHDLDDETRKAVLGEALMDELKAIREYLQDVPAIKRTVTSMDGRLAGIESEIRIIKAAVTDQSRQLQDHEHRIGGLETAR